MLSKPTKNTKTNMQTLLLFDMTTLEPSKVEWQDVCSFCCSGSSLWVTGGKLHEIQ